MKPVCPKPNRHRNPDPVSNPKDTSSTAQLTHDIQANEIAAHWLRRYLALIHAGVPFLCPLYLQCPVLRVLVMGSLESLVAGVGVRADRQYVDVSMPDPGHL